MNIKFFKLSWILFFFAISSHADVILGTSLIANGPAPCREKFMYKGIDFDGSLIGKPDLRRTFYLKEFLTRQVIEPSTFVFDPSKNTIKFKKNPAIYSDETFKIINPYAVIKPGSYMLACYWKIGELEELEEKYSRRVSSDLYRAYIELT
jgi:hypothetical protein